MLQEIFASRKETKRIIEKEKTHIRTNDDLRSLLLLAFLSCLLPSWDHASLVSCLDSDSLYVIHCCSYALPPAALSLFRLNSQCPCCAVRSSLPLLPPNTTHRQQHATPYAMQSNDPAFSSFHAQCFRATLYTNATTKLLKPPPPPFTRCDGRHPPRPSPAAPAPTAPPCPAPSPG